MPQYLYGRDSKDKVRVHVISMFKMTNDLGDYYEIRRKSGLLNGTLTDNPTKTITKGKVNRTLLEQVELELKSIVNKQRDKGYKLFTEITEGLEVDPMDYSAINALLPKGKSYSDGSQQVMLAKDPKGQSKYFDKQGVPQSGWDKDWWVSKKLDGIRCTVIMTDEGLKAITRKGKPIVGAMTKIFQSKAWKKLFTKLGNDVMIDGELYVHGRTLQSLSGDSRKEEYTPDRHDSLEFWIFDYTDPAGSIDAEQRALLLNSLNDFFPEGDNVVINSQIKLNNYDSIKKIHDLWVQDGFEGAICRAADAMYGFGTRDDRMIKVKEFQDDEFEVTGMKLGLRGAEDMCFKCITPDGKEFEAKPIGKREVKIAYAANIDDLIGKMVTVKFFNYTESGTPFLPVAVAIRDYE